jgi:hypothetical protein
MSGDGKSAEQRNNIVPDCQYVIVAAMALSLQNPINKLHEKFIHSRNISSHRVFIGISFWRE